MNKYALLAAVVLAALPTASSADNYVGISLGNGHYDIDFPGVVHGYDQEHSQAPALFIGVPVRNWLNFEVEYAQLGTYAIRNATADTEVTVQSIAAYAVPHYGAAFLRVGVERWTMNETFNGTPASMSGTGLAYGVGMEFKFNERTFIRVGFDKHMSVDDPRVNQYSGITRSYIAVMLQ